ncbi:hypothetical protein SORBI_3004G194100 [Sorghum bicolor]|uniref:Uncharacterized protein n=1 Tax=Sorghum bicolor TaxID=4558 RepID=A0A1Z5RNT2_SORBI|nr:hypothetical protein SORBI_3004G194100 [Sorghum bicolor]
MMKTKTSRSLQKSGRGNQVQGEGPNWVLVAGGVLLSTLSVKIGCKLKQLFDGKQQNNTSKAKRRSEACELHSDLYRFGDQTGCYYCMSGLSNGGVEVKQAPASPVPKSVESSLPLVKIPTPESSKENSGVMWISSPDRLEDPRRPFQYSNSSGSPCVSESGSDIYSKREVIQKLRQHLKKRDEMIMEMQTQIADLKNSLNIQIIVLQKHSLMRNLCKLDIGIQMLQMDIPMAMLMVVLMMLTCIVLALRRGRERWRGWRCSRKRLLN